MDSFQVDTHGYAEISEMIQRVAFANGWKWAGMTGVFTGHTRYLTFHPGGHLGHNAEPFNPRTMPVLSIPDCIARLKQPRTKRVKVSEALRPRLPDTYTTPNVNVSAIVNADVVAAIREQHPDLTIELPA